MFSFFMIVDKYLLIIPKKGIKNNVLWSETDGKEFFSIIGQYMGDHNPI